MEDSTPMTASLVLEKIKNTCSVCVCVCVWVYNYGIFTHLCLCFIWQLEVQCPPGVTIGFVAEHWNLCRAVYSLQNEKKEDMMGVLGPCSTYGCGSDSVFEVNKYKHVSTIFFPPMY